MASNDDTTTPREDARNDWQKACWQESSSLVQTRNGEVARSRRGWPFRRSSMILVQDRHASHITAWRSHDGELTMEVRELHDFYPSGIAVCMVFLNPEIARTFLRELRRQRLLAMWDYLMSWRARRRNQRNRQNKNKEGEKGT